MKFRIGIRRKILGTLLAIAVFAFLTTNLLWTFSVRASLEEEILKNQEKVAQDIAQRIQEFVDIKKRNLILYSQTATIIGFIELNKGEEEAYFQLSLLLRQDGDLKELSLIDILGDEKIRITPGYVYPKEELINKKQDPKFIFPTFQYGLEYVSPLYFSSDDEPMMTISVPIVIPIATRKIEELTTIEPDLDIRGRKPGDILGVLSAEVYTGDIKRAFADIALGKGGYAYIVDGEHRIINHPDPKLAQMRFDANQVDIIMRHHEYDKKLTEEGTPLPPVTIVTGTGKNELGQDVLATHIYLRRWLGVVIQQPINEAFASVYDAQRFAVILFVAGILIIGFISFRVSSWLIRPIRQLRYGIEQVRRGGLAYRVDVATKDELGELADNFNRMIKDLKDSQDALEEAKTSLEIKVGAKTRQLRELVGGLEEQVKARTKEIQEKMVDLERFNKLAVGRELKMVELKSEINKLKKDLENKKE
jgi:HAMP domain-containing protein